MTEFNNSNKMEISPRANSFGDNLMYTGCDDDMSRSRDIFEGELSKARKSFNYTIDIVKDRNHILHGMVTKDLTDESYLGIKSVSVYICDSKKRILMHRNCIVGNNLPDSSHIVPIIGICNNNDKHNITAKRTLFEQLGIEVELSDLKPVWGSENGKHVSYLYRIYETHEEFEKKLVNPKIGGVFSKYYIKHKSFESKNLPSVYYLSFDDISLLDSEFKVSKNKEKWSWTLLRPRGCTAIYNVFQWLRKFNRDSQMLTKHSDRHLSNKQIDINISSAQSVVWSILNYGVFENLFFHLGKIGCSLEICGNENMHRFVPVNAIPNLHVEDDDDIDNYCRHPDYVSDNEVHYMVRLVSGPLTSFFNEMQSFYNKNHKIVMSY